MQVSSWFSDEFSNLFSLFFTLGSFVCWVRFCLFKPSVRPSATTATAIKVATTITARPTNCITAWVDGGGGKREGSP